MFYVQENEKIVLCDEKFDILQDTIAFMPQYKNLEIQETDKNIVNFNGSFYFEDDVEYKERKQKQEAERISMLCLTKREIFLAIYADKGISPEEIRALMPDKKAQIEFDYAEKYYRGNPLVDSLGGILGYTKEDLDYLFENKSLPQKSI